MKIISDIILPQENQYTAEHLWVKKDGNTYLAGISDFAQDQLGELMFVDLPSVNDTFEANTPFGVVESLKSVNSLFMPLTGEIVEINEKLENAPTLINADCYGKGWIVRIKESADANKEALISAENYKKLLN